MGDDTFGQCGYNSLGRNAESPHVIYRIPNPVKVEMPGKAIKIACGNQHSVAILEDNTAWGWGRAHKWQLGNSEIVNKSPKQVRYTPEPIIGLSGKVIDVACGEHFSIFLIETVEGVEAWGCGLNTRGQLALGYLTHVQSLTKIPTLSNLAVTNREGIIQNVKFEDFKCGYQHCMAKLNIGALYMWGDNEYGQLGNQKRIVSEKPIIHKQFAESKIASIHCKKYNSCIVTKN